MAIGRGRDRTKLLAFYVTHEEWEKIINLAARHDMSFSDYARKVLLGRIPNSWTQDTVRKDELA